jgi:uncharacterized protein
MRGFLVLGLALLAGACASAPRVTGGRGPALWVVQSADSKVYLFGTVHVLVAQVPWLTPTIRAALADSRELWVESDVEDRTALRRAVAARAVDAAYDLPSHLTPSDRIELANAFKVCGMTSDRVEHMRPWAANTILMACSVAHMTPAGSAGQMPANATPDLYLISTARATGLQVHGFETVEQQVAAMADASDASQLAVLQRGLQRYAAVKAMPKPEAEAKARAQIVPMLGLVHSWYLGDVAALARQVDAGRQSGGPDIYRSVFAVRNERFADGIAKLLGRPTVAFVAIGAGHLAGPDSVIALLEARGITVTRLE